MTRNRVEKPQKKGWYLHDIKAYSVVGLRLRLFLISIWDVRPRRFIPGDRAPAAHSIKGWVSPRIGMDISEKREMRGFCRESNLDSSVVQQMLSHLTDCVIQTVLSRNVFMGKDHKNCNCQFCDLNCEAKTQLVEWLCWPHTWQVIMPLGFPLFNLFPNVTYF